MSIIGITEAKPKQVILDQTVYKEIFKQLQSLINLIKGKQKQTPLKTNIYDYVLYPEAMSDKNLKNKIFEILDVKNNKGVFTFILKELIGIFALDSSLDLKNSLKIEFFKIVESLTFFKSYSLIYYFHNNKRNNKPYDLFSKYILADNSFSKTEISSYINLFNLKDILTEEFSKDHQKLLKIADPSKILLLISSLKLQNVFTFKYIIKNHYNIISQGRIYNALSCYNRNISEINDIINLFVLSNSNKIQPSTIDKIFNDIEISCNLNNNSKMLLIEKLMINYSIKIEKISGINNKELTELCIYYAIVSNNINIISEHYFINWELFKEVFNAFFEKDKNTNNFENTINFVKSIKNINIIKLKLGDELIESFIKTIPPNRVSDFANIIKDNINLINYLLNNFKRGKKKDGANLITKLNLKKNEYDESYDNYTIGEFLNYKYKTCLNEHFHILIDFGLINENTYNILMNKMLKNKGYKIVRNNDNLISLNEDNEQFNNTHKSKLNKLRSKYKTSRNDMSHQCSLSTDEKNKILVLYHFGNIKCYELSEINKELITNVFGENPSLNDSLISNFYDDNDYNDDVHYLSIEKEKQKVIFINDIESFKVNSKYFKKSKYIGVDSEWIQPLCANNYKENASILQLANEEETHIMIIDLLKLKNEQSFVELFRKYFKNKTFVGFSFNNSDLEKFSDGIRNVFIDSTIVDLVELYQYKYLEKAGSLSSMCEKFLDKKLCKDQQCSNWEKRELDQRQLNYAALDALVCVQLYKKLVKST